MSTRLLAVVMVVYVLSSLLVVLFSYYFLSPLVAFCYVLGGAALYGFFRERSATRYPEQTATRKRIESIGTWLLIAGLLVIFSLQYFLRQ